MKKILLIGLIFGGLLDLEAEKLVVVAGENFKADTLAIEEIRSIYSAKRLRLKNQKLIPLNLGIDSALRNKFEVDVLGEDRETLAHDWLQAHYLGHHAPKVFKSPEMAAEFLTKVDNSLGYMDEDTAQKYHLKILYRAKE